MEKVVGFVAGADRRTPRDGFDPVVEGARYRLSRELPLAIWDRVCADATDASGLRDDTLALARFHALATRAARRGGRLRPDPGRITRVIADAGERSQSALDAELLDELEPPAPGRTTLQAAEAQRAAATDSPQGATADAGATEQSSPPQRRVNRARGSGAAVLDPGAYLAPAMTELLQRLAPHSALRRAVLTATRDPVHTLAGRIPREPAPGSEAVPGSEAAPGSNAASGSNAAPGSNAASGSEPAPGNAAPGSNAMLDGRALWRIAERRAATLYRRAVSHHAAGALDPAVAAALQHRRGGQPLPAPLQREMEHALGISLAAVRVHVDADAARAARALGASAFALGEDLFFADGAFAPDTAAGRRLIAHELAHVAQALRGSDGHAASGLRVSDPGEPAEREADAFASGIADTPPADRALAPAQRDADADADADAEAATPTVAPPTAAPPTAASAAVLYRQQPPAPAAGSTGDPQQLRATLRSSGIEVEDQDADDLAHLYPDGIVLAAQPVQVLAILPDAYFGRQVVAFEVRPARQVQSAVSTYLLQVGHGRAIVVSSHGGPSVMLDAGSITARPAVARGLAELLGAGLAAPPQRILVSSTDADHTNEITRVLTVAGMQGAQVEVARQIIQSTIGAARWNRLGLTRIANQVVEINVIGGGVHQQRRLFGNMVITELRLVAPHTAAAGATTESRYRAQANAVSPVTVVQDMVSGDTQVFQADATPRALSQIVDSIGDDAYRALLGGGGRNLRTAEDPHHGGTVSGGDAGGFIRNLRLQFEASRGDLQLFTQTGQRFSSGAFAHVRVLNQVGVNVATVTEPTPGGAGADVTRMQGGTATQMTINQGQIQQVIQGAQGVQSQIMDGYRRLHELRDLEERLSPVRDAVGLAGLREQVQSTDQIAQQLQQQRQALNQGLDRFWNELETAASGAQGMRAGINLTQVQAEGQAVGQLVGQNRIEPLQQSVEAHQGMLSITESLVANGFGMLDALQSSNFQRVENLKVEQEALFRSAATVIGAREVLEHVRTAWNESGVSPRTFRNLAARIGEAAAEREIETRVSVAAGRRIEAQVRTQQILDGTLPGSTVTPAPMGRRVGAGLLAAIEVLRIALDIALQVRQANQASAAAAAAQVQRGRNMVQWWVDRGVRPQLGLLDESNQPAALTQDQIWSALFGTPPPGVPANARAVVTQVAADDKRRAVAQLTLACTTLNDWYRMVNDGARERESHGWTPFTKNGGQWVTLEFNVAANEYQGTFDQEVHNALERLYTRLTSNQQSDLDMQNASAAVQTVRDSALVIGHDRVVYVWTSPGVLGSINFGTVQPRFVRVTDSVVSASAQGKVVVRAADTATYARLRSTYWMSAQTWIGQDSAGHYFEANQEAKALVDPGDLQPAPAVNPAP